MRRGEEIRREEHSQEWLCHKTSRTDRTGNREGEKSTAKNGCATKDQQQTRIGNQDLLGILLFCFCMRGKSTAGNRSGIREFSAGAGPLPVSGFGYKFGADGIPLDTVADALEFSGVSDPVIEGLILPKGFAYAAQGGVAVPCGHAFHDTGDFRKDQARLQQDVNVVGHDHKGVQFVAAKLRAAQDGVFGVSSNFGIGQPARSECGGVQSGVKQLESFAGRVFVFSGTAIPAAIEGHGAVGPFSAVVILDSTKRAAQPGMAVPQGKRV